MADSIDALRGALADRYEVRGEIGSGGMATIYHARDLKHDRDVALKVFRPEVAEFIGSERFFREIRIAAKLSHPHILPLHDSGQAEGLLYYVMPFVQGMSLRARLEAERQLPLPEALRITTQVASALDYAHRQGIVHRDIKPENILLQDGQALVADFGIALAVHVAAGQRLTQTGLSVGTPMYMSPEQATGDPRLDGRTDIFSLACVLYEMLCGDPPFTGSSTQVVVARLLTERAADVRGCRENVPEHVARAVSQALSKVPADRQETAGRFADALERAAPGRPEEPAGSAHRWRYFAAGGVVLAGALAAALLLVRRDDGAGQATSPVRQTLIVSTDGLAQDPALSPDGKLIAYVAGDGQGAQVDLYVRLVEGGQPVRLTSDEAAEGAPVFSPDGGRIAFMRHDRSGGLPAVWVIPALGGDASPVIANAGFPAWSPSGQELAVVLAAGEAASRVARVGLDGTVRRIVFRNESPYMGIRRITWSADGQWIGMARSRGGASSEIWIVPADSGAPRALLDEPASVVSGDPMFMPDGPSLIYSSSRGGATNLWRVALQGGDPVQLTSGAGPDHWPSVAGDGGVVYQNSRWRNLLVAFDTRTGASRTLTTHTPYLWAPAFAPDGREVAWSRGDVDGTWSIWMSSVEGGAGRRLTTGPEPTIYPRFTPDGRALVYSTWTAAPGRLWKVPREGGPAEALTPPDMDAAYGDVSPDGRSLAFARTEGGVTRIHIATLGPSGIEGAARLSDAPGTLPRWSPDGKWLAFTRDRGYQAGIFVVRPDGTGERQVAPTGGWPVWWPDGSRIGYISVAADGRQEYFSVTVPAGEIRRIAVPFASTNSPFDVSPDGGTILTTDAVHLGDEIWLRAPER